MKKERYSVCIIIIILSLIFSNCASAPTTGSGQPYPSDTAFYPAVYGAFKDLFPNARYQNINFYNDIYTFTGITGLALTTPISYDLTVRLTNNNQIEFSWDNLYQRDANGRWSSAKAFGFYNYDSIINTLKTKMLEIANNPSLYQQRERAAMADIKFVHAIMNDLTDLAFRDFIDNYARGSIFNVTGLIQDVTEANRTINGVTYSYLITVNQSFIDPTDAFFSAALADVRCSFYTNQDNVIRLNRRDEQTVQGILINASRTISGLSLQLVNPN
ncbi:MAG: hypothetical protein FWC22_08235 [Treponema sp.]|nr:hypothetical protein [Treponema sp.]